MKMKKFIILLSSITVAVLAGCSLFNDKTNDQDNKQGDFEIYLLPSDADWQEEVENSACETTQGIVLSNPDIQSYDLDTHEIRLNESAAERLAETKLVGHQFVVCANQEAIYTGEFMAAFMSRSSERVVILWPPMNGDERVMKIQLGYPGPDFFAGKDPRGDIRILQALEQAGLSDEPVDN